MLIFFADGLLSQKETVVQAVIDASLYFAGLPLLLFPILMGCGWVVGFAVFRPMGAKKAPPDL
ncbi:hypothetical protein [Aliiroseovarius halocynthiae]|uniref:Uncharacterized protein n=1 Tax=Aliiroseovarius halocynthiae TaxID=985055 RepID=A0A545SR07_9RHOB|nr:hypothetical protein [Aliiroseovarius halocynthiae]TQV67420.1 hypothetical protein FIL88_09340 [Aliiroseovarius halocynthiae]